MYINMYERNAIVIERYFADLFGYNERNNLKSNWKNYFDLVSKLENFQEISRKEDIAMAEFEDIASEIKESQKKQEGYIKKNLRLQETRKALFESLEEKSESLEKKFAKIDEEETKNSEEIKLNVRRFIDEISRFRQSSITRTEYGKQRRKAENEYQVSLKATAENLNGVRLEKLQDIKRYLKEQNNELIKEDIETEISKNGAKEKIPFDIDTIIKSIDIATEIEEKKVEIFVTIYERTVKLLSEIKNDSIKIEKHQKTVKDSNSKLRFLNVVTEYLVLYLDNERMNVVGGEKEHKKMMEQACKNIERDLVEIKNMYELIVKEGLGKASKKLYKESYNLEYLNRLKEEEQEFEESVSKIQVMGTVIFPDYWRIEGMQKIYDTFRDIIINVYEKDLTEFEPMEKNVEDVLESQISDNNILNDETNSTDDIPDFDFKFDLDEEDDDFEDDEDYETKIAGIINNEEDDEDNYDEYDEDEDDNEDDYDIDEDEDDEYEEYDEDDNDDFEEDEDENNDKDETDLEIDEILGFYGSDSRK